MRLATRLAHAGCPPDPRDYAVAASPVFSTTFERDAHGALPGGHVYSRDSNPTRSLLEATLADLDGGAAAAAFGSGQAAVAAVLNSLPVGSRVLLPDDVYHGVRALCAGPLADRLRAEPVDMSDRDAFRDALAPGDVALVWIETPSNPLCKITDVDACVALAHQYGARACVDATWPTPLLVRPLERGADFVVHSLTKYLAGHSDVLGGAVIAREADALAPVRQQQKLAGGVLDPFSCWLTLRGLRTLDVRFARQCANAAAVADVLVAHPAVAAVHYPGLASHPGHDVAARQMQLGGVPCFGAMLSFETTDEASARRVAGGTQVFRQATSLGGTESLIEHRRPVEPPTSTTPPTLLRVSCGLEAADDLIDDLARALAA